MFYSFYLTTGREPWGFIEKVKEKVREWGGNPAKVLR